VARKQEFVKNVENIRRDKRMKYILFLLLTTQLGADNIQLLEMEQRLIIAEILVTHDRLCMMEMKIEILEGLK
jgi:hypothetical protein